MIISRRISWKKQKTLSFFHNFYVKVIHYSRYRCTLLVSSCDFDKRNVNTLENNDCSDYHNIRKGIVFCGLQCKFVPCNSIRCNIGSRLVRCLTLKLRELNTLQLIKPLRFTTLLYSALEMRNR